MLLDIFPAPYVDNNRPVGAGEPLSQQTRCALQLAVTRRCRNEEELGNFRHEALRLFELGVELSCGDLIAGKLALDADEFGSVLVPVSPDVHPVLRLTSAPMHSGIGIGQNVRKMRPRLSLEILPILRLGQADVQKRRHRALAFADPCHSYGWCVRHCNDGLAP